MDTVAANLLHISCALIFDAQGRVLMLRRHRTKHGGGMWGFPGGKRDGAEDMLATALRETHEETGLLFDDMQYLGTHYAHLPTDEVHITSFTVQAPDGALVTTRPSEHEAYRWFAVEDLLVQPDILWGAPTMLRDFGLMPHFKNDPTLVGDSSLRLLSVRQ